MLRLACCAALLACASQVMAQVTETRIAGLTWLHLHAADASKVGVVLAWPLGGVHDPADRTGLAQTVRAFLELSQRHQPPTRRFFVESHDGFTLLWQTVGVPDLPAGLAFLGRLLSGKVEITADLHALALARARLQADDSTCLYPGRALHNKARRCLFPRDPRGRQVAGIPAEIAQISMAELRARYRDHYGTRGAFLATVGGIAAPELETQLRQHLTVASGVENLPAPVKPMADRQVVRSAIHPRVDGPYVTLAIPAPEPACSHPAFLVAVGAMRHQAYTYFGKQRGQEWLAGFPFVRHEWRTGDPVVMINRRGRRAGSCDDVRLEIRGFLQAIRRQGLREQYVRMARQEITNTLQRPWKGAPREVVFRARVLCLRRLLGFDDAFLARVAKVEAEEARAVLLDCLREDLGCWLEFRPDPALVVRGFQVKRR